MIRTKLCSRRANLCRHLTELANPHTINQWIRACLVRTRRASITPFNYGSSKRRDRRLTLAPLILFIPSFASPVQTFLKLLKTFY